MEHDLEHIYQYIDDNVDEHISRLQDWIRQPSVSNTGEGIRECAEMTRSYFEELGCQKSHVVDVGVTEWGAQGNPVVYAEYDAGAPKTVLVYMMYDTMPVHDASRWSSHPYEANVVPHPTFGSVLIGRGAVNSKGPQMAIINSLLSVHRVTNTLPVNLIFVAEGDEERMSIGLRKFVKERKAVLARVDAMIGWGGQNTNGIARIWCGSEGGLYFELETSGRRWGKGPKKGPIHGGHKRIVDSPAWRHIKMLSTFVDDTGNRIRVDGWYDHIEQPTESDLALIDEAMQYFDAESLRRDLKINGFMENLNTKDLLVQSLYGTSFNIDGIWGGLTEPGTAGSILPHKVTSKHNCRYVPNQNGSDLLKKIRTHLDKQGYEDVELRVIGDVPAVKANYDTEIARAVIEMYKTFDVEYAMLPGTGIALLGPYWPAYLFNSNPLQIPVVMGGLGHGGRAHAIDEYYVIEGNGRVHGLAGAEKGFATILYNYARLSVSHGDSASIGT